MPSLKGLPATSKEFEPEVNRFFQPKYTRSGKPKTRTGCPTCKVRRIKCDEGRPACRRCISAGWTCEGYSANPTEKAEIRAQARHQTPVHLALSISPSNFYGSARESRSFQYFLLTSASSLAGSFGMEFWKVQLPQVAQQHEVIRHAIVSVASLHELLRDSHKAALGYWTSDAVELAARHRFAIQQYNIAIRAMVNLVPGTSESMEITLLGCLLFICFEFLHGRFIAAAVHLQNGLRIMNEWLKCFRQMGNIESPSLQENLAQIFDGLSIQTFLMDEPLSYICSRSVSCRAENINGESSMSALQRARYELEYILLDSFPKAKLCKELAIQPERLGRAKMGLCLAEFCARLKNWNDNFLTFCLSNKDNLTTRDHNAAQYLQRTQLSALVWAKTALCPEETAYDVHIDTFEVIIASVESQLLRERANDTSLHDFTFETSFLGHTYFVAQKCRHRKLRRRALTILKEATPRQEGIWKAGLLANVAQRIIELEEEGLEEGSSAWPTEEKRVVDAYGVAGVNAWVDSWKYGNSSYVEHQLLLKEQNVTFRRRPRGLNGGVEFKMEVISLAGRFRRGNT